MRESLQEKGQEAKEKLENEEIRQSLMRSMVEKAFEKLGLFYESLQALVEGRREVLHNEDFVFEDGMTVKEKQ